MHQLLNGYKLGIRNKITQVLHMNSYIVEQVYVDTPVVGK